MAQGMYLFLVLTVAALAAIIVMLVYPLASMLSEARAGGPMGVPQTPSDGDADGNDGGGDDQ